MNKTLDPRPLRKSAYPDIGNQLDAIWKALALIQEQGFNIGDDASYILGEVNRIKEKFQKKNKDSVVGS